MWININQLYARLTAVGLCSCPSMAEDLCGILLEEPIVRENPTLFALNISAAAQLMIHAGLHVYTCCQENLHTGREGKPASGWNDWKAAFRKAGNLEDPRASKDALTAVRSMNQAEWAYRYKKDESMLRSKKDRKIQIGVSTTQTPQKQESIHGTKRRADEAFSAPIVI